MAPDPVPSTEDVRVDGPAGPRRIVMAVYPDLQLLDAVGPLEVFAAAGESAAGRPAARGYALRVVGPEAGMVRASSGLGLAADAPWEALEDGPPPDTLIIAGGDGSPRAAGDERLLAVLRAVAPRVRRLCSVCTGAHVLAAAGLLDGRRVTTHWGFADWLARHYPSVEVDPDSIFVRDGDLWTSAGVTAGMDLALALVEDDLGRDIALEVSRRMVLFLRRPGGQSQFSAQLAGELAERDALRDLQALVVDRPALDHSVEALAERVGMSPRHFARVFRGEVGQSPARFVEAVRVEAARRLLETTRRSLDEVAAGVGLGTAETLRRVFWRRLGVRPSAYRERFRVETAGSVVRRTASGRIHVRADEGPKGVNG